VVPGLDPSDLFKQGFKGLPFHGQNDSDQDPKLRQRNRWCFFSQPDFQVPKEKMRQHAR
jgi:hypothetical protein